MSAERFYDLFVAKCKSKQNTLEFSGFKEEKTSFKFTIAVPEAFTGIMKTYFTKCVANANEYLPMGGKLRFVEGINIDIEGEVKPENWNFAIFHFTIEIPTGLLNFIKKFLLDELRNGQETDAEVLDHVRKELGCDAPDAPDAPNAFAKINAFNAPRDKADRADEKAVFNSSVSVNVGNDVAAVGKSDNVASVAKTPLVKSPITEAGAAVAVAERGGSVNSDSTLAVAETGLSNDVPQLVNWSLGCI